MLLLALFGCPSGPHDTDVDTDAAPPTPVDTDPARCPDPTLSCDDLQGCFGAIGVHPVEFGDHQLGASFAVVEGPSLVVGAPGSGSFSPKFVHGATAHLFDVVPWPTGDLQTVRPAAFQEAGFEDDAYPPSVPRMGADLITPGDLTGDGVPDLVALEDTSVGLAFGNVLVFPGPIATGPTGRGYSSPDTVVLTVPAARFGVPCGDLDADGLTDLCVEAGVLAGPITSASGIAYAWPEGSSLVSSVEADGRVLIWDRAAGRVEELAGSPAGPVSTGLGAPVTGTPVAWTRAGETLLVAAETAGGFTVSAIALGSEVPAFTLAVPTRPEALAYVDVDGDGVRDVLVGADDEVTLWDGASASTGRGCPLGVLTTLPGSGLGQTIRVLELDGVDPPELVIGAPDEVRDSAPPRNGAAYLLRLPLDPAASPP